MEGRASAKACRPEIGGHIVKISLDHRSREVQSLERWGWRILRNEILKVQKIYFIQDAMGNHRNI